MRNLFPNKPIIPLGQYLSAIGIPTIRQQEVKEALADEHSKNKSLSTVLDGFYKHRVTVVNTPESDELIRSFIFSRPEFSGLSELYELRRQGFSDASSVSLTTFIRNHDISTSHTGTIRDLLSRYSEKHPDQVFFSDRFCMISRSSVDVILSNLESEIPGLYRIIEPKPKVDLEEYPLMHPYLSGDGPRRTVTTGIVALLKGVSTEISVHVLVPLASHDHIQASYNEYSKTITANAYNSKDIAKVVSSRSNFSKEHEEKYHRSLHSGFLHVAVDSILETAVVRSFPLYGTKKSPAASIPFHMEYSIDDILVVDMKFANPQIFPKGSRDLYVTAQQASLRILR